MSLRNNLQKTAARLISNNGDTIHAVVSTLTPSGDEFTPPTRTTELVPIDAVVTGASSWVNGETILHGDLRAVISGAFPLLSVGDKMQVNGVEYTITVVDPKLATGVVSAVIYFMRR